MESDVTLFTPADVHMMAREKSYGEAGSQGFRAENPYTGHDLVRALGPSQDLTVTIGAGGAEIASLDIDEEADTGRGLHRMRWNLRRSSRGDSQSRRRGRGRRIEPGDYVVRLVANGEVSDARSTSTTTSRGRPPSGSRSRTRRQRLEERLSEEARRGDFE